MRSSMRGLLRVADEELEKRAAGAEARDDDYDSAGKPCRLRRRGGAGGAGGRAGRATRDALLAVLSERKLVRRSEKAARLVATVVGQDLEEGADGVFRIARRVAEDRVISTVDPEARHGHKTAARGFDGYKGHIAIDPDSEIITATR